MSKTKTTLLLLALCACMIGATVVGLVHATLARASGFTLTDFSIPAGGQEPWGITFDSSGNVWVAITGCDPTPTCSPSTPPGKIAEYDPTTSSWIATYTLPKGYAQPLFLAFGPNSTLWFAMPNDNALGTLSLTTHTFHKYAVPTAKAGPGTWPSTQMGISGLPNTI